MILENQKQQRPTKNAKSSSMVTCLLKCSMQMQFNYSFSIRFKEKQSYSLPFNQKIFKKLKHLNLNLCHSTG